VRSPPEPRPPTRDRTKRARPGRTRRPPSVGASNAHGVVARVPPPDQAFRATLGQSPRASPAQLPKIRRERATVPKLPTTLDRPRRRPEAWKWAHRDRAPLPAAAPKAARRSGQPPSEPWDSQGNMLLCRRPGRQPARAAPEKTARRRSNPFPDGRWSARGVRVEKLGDVLKLWETSANGRQALVRRSRPRSARTL
jgi:hypothetical protein